MRDVFLKNGGETGRKLEIKEVKAFVLAAFAKVKVTGECTLEFISRTSTLRNDFKFVLHKDGTVSFFDYSRNGGAEQHDQIKRGPKAITTQIIWNVFKNPNWNSDRFYDMPPKTSPDELDKASAKSSEEYLDKEYPVRKSGK